MAPELCRESKYDNKVDVWATGVIIYVLLTGKPPFVGRSKDIVYRNIINAAPDLSKLANASSAAKEVIVACLEKSPADRPSMADLLNFEWFKQSSAQ